MRVLAPYFLCVVCLNGLLVTGCNLDDRVSNDRDDVSGLQDARADLTIDSSVDVPVDLSVDVALDQTPDDSLDVDLDVHSDVPVDTHGDAIGDEGQDVPPDEPPAPRCGDGLINQGSEECDDGNNASVDGCSANCIIEDGYICPRPGNLCLVPDTWEWDTSTTYVPVFPAATTGVAVISECPANQFLMQILPQTLDGRIVQTTIYCSALRAPDVPGDRLLNVTPNGSRSQLFGSLPRGNGRGLSAGQDGHLFSFTTHLDAGNRVVGFDILEGSASVIGGEVRRLSSSISASAIGNTSSASSYTTACAVDELPTGVTGFIGDTGTESGFIHRFGLTCAKVTMIPQP